jgi:hypothetical protein
MTHAGCVVFVCVFVLTCAFGMSRASAHGVSLWLGLAFGIVAWLALMFAYAAGLSVYDAITARKHPNREGVPGWAIGLVWLVFFAMVPAAWWIFRRIG